MKADAPFEEICIFMEIFDLGHQTMDKERSTSMSRHLIESTVITKLF